MSKTHKTISISLTVLGILYDIGEGTLRAFLSHPYSHVFCHHKNKTSFRSAVARLKRAGMIKKNSDTFYLTKKGEKEAFLASVDIAVNRYNLIKPKWDGKWRLMLFDVPEKRRKHRDYLRQLIKNLGLKELQKSVWIYPYPLPDFLRDILIEERLLAHTRVITTSEIDYDKDMRRVFNVN